MQKEPSHWVAVVSVDVLGDGDEANAERDQFLDAFDGGGYAPPPSVQLPDEHRVDTAHASVVQQLVKLGPQMLGTENGDFAKSKAYSRAARDCRR